MVNFERIEPLPHIVIQREPVRSCSGRVAASALGFNLARTGAITPSV